MYICDDLYLIEGYCDALYHVIGIRDYLQGRLFTMHVN